MHGHNFHPLEIRPAGRRALLGWLALLVLLGVGLALWFTPPSAAQ